MADERGAADIEVGGFVRAFCAYAATATRWLELKAAAARAPAAPDKNLFSRANVNNRHKPSIEGLRSGRPARDLYFCWGPALAAPAKIKHT